MRFTGITTRTASSFTTGGTRRLSPALTRGWFSRQFLAQPEESGSAGGSWLDVPSVQGPALSSGA